MSIDYGPSSAARRRPLVSALLLALVAFLLGIAAMAWALTRWDAAAIYLGIRPAPLPQPVVTRPAAAPSPAPAVPVQAGAPETQRLVIDPETTRRVARLEQRVAEIDSQSRTAAGNANRAEGLLIALAARRALDRGVGLGYIEGLLQQRFGNTQRQAVATVITASRQPVTLDRLQAGLQEVGPELTGAGPDQNWWTALKTELSGIVTVRRAGTTSTMPAERLRRATRSLEAGQVDVALLEVLRMPGRENAAAWIAEARRYVAARRALDVIETAALLEPHAPQPDGMTRRSLPARAVQPPLSPV
ncbi:MAG: hypothetical protein M3N39_06255 [Pseudomonadota bacterium]|nr:hypothetical protein [Pseudomonadota bacterium]